jgi:hypothetical protein
VGEFMAETRIDALNEKVNLGIIEPNRRYACRPGTG